MPAKVSLTMLVFIFDRGTLDVAPDDVLELCRNGKTVAAVSCKSVPVKQTETPGGDIERTAFVTVGVLNG